MTSTCKKVKKKNAFTFWDPLRTSPSCKELKPTHFSVEIIKSKMATLALCIMAASDLKSNPTHAQFFSTLKTNFINHEPDRHI